MQELSENPASVRVLLVDDDADIRVVTGTYLRARDYDVVEADDAASCRRLLGEAKPDVVILDLGLPDDDGLNLVWEIRESQPTPLIVASGRDALGDRTAGLDLGADDYLIKPVALPELASRINAIVRRSQMSAPPPHQEITQLDFGPLSLDTAALRASVDGSPIELTKMEFRLLEYLARASGRTLTHADLLAGVWGSSPDDQSEKTVSEHVYRLRRKLDLGERGPQITSVRGVGYRFDA